MTGDTPTTIGSETVYAALCGVCGLTLADAAEYLGISALTSRRYSSGDREAPPASIARLVDLWRVISTTTDSTDILGQPIPPAAINRRLALKAAGVMGRKTAAPTGAALQALTPAAKKPAKAERRAANKAAFRAEKNATRLPALTDPRFTYEGLEALQPGDTIVIMDRVHLTMEGVPGFGDTEQEVYEKGKAVRTNRLTVAEVTHIVGGRVHVSVLHSHSDHAHMRREQGATFQGSTASFNSKVGEGGPLTFKLANPSDRHGLIAEFRGQYPTPVPTPLPVAPPVVEAAYDEDEDIWPYPPEDAVSDEGISGMRMPWSKVDVEDMPSF